MCSWNLEILLLFFFLICFLIFSTFLASIFSCFNTLEVDKEKVPCECSSCYSFIFLYILQAFKWISSHLSSGLLMPRPPAPTAI